VRADGGGTKVFVAKLFYLVKQCEEGAKTSSIENLWIEQLKIFGFLVKNRKISLYLPHRSLNI
jgi:hypothetical protein